MLSRYRYNDSIEKIVKDPTLIIEGLAQGSSDAVEENGIAYSSGYAVGEVGQIVIGTKGFDKLKAVSSASKIAETSEMLRYSKYWDNVTGSMESEINGNSN